MLYRSKRWTHPQRDLGREYNSLILGPLGHTLAIRQAFAKSTRDQNGSELAYN